VFHSSISAAPLRLKIAVPVLGQNHLVSEAAGVEAGGPDAAMGDEPGDHHGPGVARCQFTVQVGLLKSAAVCLVDVEIIGRGEQGGVELPPGRSPQQLALVGVLDIDDRGARSSASRRTIRAGLT
jgi:hypothetical protein